MMILFHAFFRNLQGAKKRGQIPIFSNISRNWDLTPFYMAIVGGSEEETTSYKGVKNGS
jgi:hypothetical protein